MKLVTVKISHQLIDSKSQLIEKVQNILNNFIIYLEINAKIKDVTSSSE